MWDGDCDQHINVGDWPEVGYYTGKTLTSCTDACRKNINCTQFAIGKIGTSNEGKCFLFQNGCQKNENADWEMYAVLEQGICLFLCHL